MKTIPPKSPPRPTRQISLMHAFRMAAEQGDARKGTATFNDGARELSVQAQQRRHGTDEATLKRHLSIDLGNLMNTVRLDAVVPLDDVPFVAKSVVNFGFRDLSSLTKSQETMTRIAAAIRQTLIDHEPRLVPSSIDVVLDDTETTDQRISFSVNAEIIASPSDVPLNFVAEVDIGAGKIRMSDLKVSR